MPAPRAFPSSDTSRTSKNAGKIVTTSIRTSVLGGGAVGCFRRIDRIRVGIRLVVAGELFEQAGGRHEEPASEGWTWKDLLSSLEEHDEEGEAEAEAASRPLEEILADEIGAMGIDPTALLPRSRIHELAVALQVRDVDGARTVVRKLAPAATRRLTRKLFTDEPLKRQVMTYLARYNELLEDAAERDAEGFVVETLLSSEPGRTYLLFDAAAGDLA